MLKNVKTYLFIVLMVLLPCICGATPVQQKAVSGEANVTDQAGRAVKIGSQVDRIVSGYYISSSACIALGLADRLVGIEARAASRPIYSLAAPKLIQLPAVGTARNFDLEACIALKPDLVILPLRLRDSAQTLAELGIPAILVNPESYEELTEMIALIGEATGRAAAARRLLDYYERSKKNISNLTAAIKDADKPSVYMCGVSSHLTTAPRGMYQSTMIELAGGKNAAAIDGNSWTEISYEHLLAINPDVIIIPAEAGYGVAEILGNADLQRLKAVLGGKVYKMPADFEAWDSPVPSCMLGILWSLHVLHEDRYSIDSLRKETAAFYHDFYGFEINSALIQ